MGMGLRAWQLNNLAGPEDPAWRSRNTGHGTRAEGENTRERAKRDREDQGVFVCVYVFARACRPIRN